MVSIGDIAGIAGIILGSLSLSWQLIKHYRESKPQIDLGLEYRWCDVKTEKLIEITCCLSNIGKAKLVIDRARIFIDEGTIGENSELRFPKLWVWKKECPDCELSIWCQRDTSNRYPTYVDQKEINGKYTKSIELEYLVKAVQYVMPMEKFYETRILSLPPNKFYRITFIVIPKKIKFLKIFERKVDCLCLYRIVSPLPLNSNACSDKGCSYEL